MTRSIDQLRRDATALKKGCLANDPAALTRVNSHLPQAKARLLGQVTGGGLASALKRADFLHVIAREQGFASWPQLKAALEVQGMDRAEQWQRLGIAITQGQTTLVQRLLAETPDLPLGRLGLCCGLYLKDEVARLIDADPGAATRPVPKFTPMIALARSRMIHLYPEREGDMLAIADLLLARGADVNDTCEMDGQPLSALYWAIGHADNMALGEWLLDHGANPNDGESLYHATELGHHGGLRLLLAHGADPRGTNALLRAMDFHDVDAVRMLLAAGARADDFNDAEPGGEAPWTVPALHQAARRMSPPEMVALLLDAGANPERIFDGVTPYAYARIFGNADLARQLEARGHATPLDPTQTLLAQVADGEVPEGAWLDPEKMPKAARNIVREILHLPGKLDHVKRLVAVGAEYDRPDASGVPPVQAAGWVGLPEVMGYLIAQKPDLGHVNGFGGTLLGTILHGSENNPDRAGRDYIGCLRLALEEGVALPRGIEDRVDDPEIAAFLRDWAKAHPGQVVDPDPA
jgi:hypothetical protein